jgi:hypothetical protein
MDRIEVWGQGPAFQSSWRQMTRFGHFRQVSEDWGCMSQSCEHISHPAPAPWWVFEPNHGWVIRKITWESDGEFQYHFYVLERTTGVRRVYFVVTTGGGFWDRFAILSPPPRWLIQRRRSLHGRLMSPSH